MDYLDKPDPQTFIAHHGIKGQKWGVRRFQNADGSLTKAGKERYNEQNSSDSSDNHENQKFHLTEKQKKYCKTVAIATGAALVAYAGFSEDIHLSKKNAIGDVYDALSKMPNSARGELSVTWKGHNGGHSLAWEVINNKPVIFDFQTHKVYETPDKFSEIANMFDGLSTATSCRLDDKDLNLDLLRRWVTHS